MINSALGKLPGIHPHPFSPKHATLVIAKDDPDIGPVSFRVYHVKTYLLNQPNRILTPSMLK